MRGLSLAAASAGAVAAAAIIKFGRDSVKAYSESQDAQARLSDAYARFPRLADASQASLGRLNTELSKKTRFDDDATASAQALLASFKLTGQQITQLTPLLQDYAAKTGKDLPKASKDLGRAILGQGRALKVIGLDFKDTGSAAGNFEQLMGGLRTQVGGFAEKEGRTAAGQAAILSNQFGELEEQVGAKLTPALLKGGDALLKVIGFIDRNSSVIGPLTVGVAGLAGAIWSVNKASSGIDSAKRAWDTLSGAIGRAGGAAGAGRAKFAGMASLLGGPWVLALTAGAGALAFYAKKQADSRARVEELRGALDQQTGAITRNARELAFKNLQDRGAIDSAKALGLSLQDVTDAALGNRTAMARIQSVINGAGQAAADMAGSEGDAAEAARDHARSAITLQDALGDQNTELRRARAGLKDAAAAGVIAEGAMGGVADAATDQAAAVNDSTEALKKNARAILGLRGNENDYEAAIDDANEALKDNGKTLDRHTEKGRANRAALDKVAASTLDWRDAVKEAGGSQKTQNRITELGREQLVKMGQRFGMTEKDARSYGRAVLGLPKRHTTDIKADTRDAIAGLKNFKYQANRNLDGIGDESITIKVRLPTAAKDWINYRSGERGDGYGITGRPPVTGGPSGDGFGVSVRPSVDSPSGGQWRGFDRKISSRMESLSDDLDTFLTRRVSQAAMMMGGGSAGGGWKRQWALVHAMFPNARLHSAYRPGARTTSGSQSYHAVGRAIDVTPSMAIFNWIRSNYGARTKELIYSPAGGRQIHNGRNHYYTGAVRRMHFKHLHWAYDRGGVATGSGWIPKVTSAPERVLSPGQTRAFDGLVRVLDRRPTVVQSVGQAGSIDYARLGDHVVKAFVRAGVSVQMDGRAVGRVIGGQADLYGRGG
jgi:hypothetical protein